MHSVKFNGKAYSIFKFDTSENTLIFELMLVPSMDELQRDVLNHSGDIVIEYDGEAIRTFVDYGTFVSMTKDIDTTHVTVILAKTFDDEAALEILVGERITPIAASAYRVGIEELADFADDETAGKYAWAYHEWESGVEYKVGDKRTDYGVLYKCLQAHVSQDNWRPSESPSLWAKVINEDPTGDYPVWEQPDSTNPYMKGDRVYYPTKNDKIYESVVDNNVWSPAAYGWSEVE